jgi:hypothetical protein
MAENVLRALHHQRDVPKETVENDDVGDATQGGWIRQLVVNKRSSKD